MQKTIVLIACSSTKLRQRNKARDLYVSDLFKKNLLYGESLAPDEIFILSAKHGLVALDDELDPYDCTLNNLPIEQVRHWGALIIRQLRRKFDIGKCHFVILAGRKYQKYLVPHLNSYETPLAGLAIGKQLQWLINNTEQPEPRRQIS